MRLDRKNAVSSSPHSARPYSGYDPGLVVQAGIDGEVVETPGRARLRIGGAEHDQGDAGRPHRARAHRARLERHHQRVIAQVPGAGSFRGGAAARGARRARSGRDRARGRCARGRRSRRSRAARRSRRPARRRVRGRARPARVLRSSTRGIVSVSFGPGVLIRWKSRSQSPPELTAPANAGRRFAPAVEGISPRPTSCRSPCAPASGSRACARPVAGCPTR